MNTAGATTRPAPAPAVTAPGGDSVVVVVVLYNSEALVPDFLASLDAGMAGVDWNLVAVDNASTDRGVALVRELRPEARVVETGRNAGYAAGINAGVAASPPHSAVLVLNPDVRLKPGCVPALLRGLRRPGVGIAVPRLLDANAELIQSMRREPTLGRAVGDALFGASRVGRFPSLGEVVTDPAAYEAERRTDWAEGSTQLISADCWRHCGPWDESFFLYSEETDFGLRARDAGYSTLFVPGAEATHLEGGSGGTPGLWALLVVNRVRLFRRRNGVLRGLLFWTATLVREGSRAAIGRPTSKAAVRALVSPRRLREPPGPHSVW